MLCLLVQPSDRLGFAYLLCTFCRQSRGSLAELRLQQAERPEVQHFLPNALSVPGVLHQLHNSTKDMVERLPNFQWPSLQ
jgi:hypothetical protein